MSTEATLKSITALGAGRPNGWSKNDLDILLKDLGEDEPKETRTLLTNLNHIERDNNTGRYRVLGPHLVKSLDDTLILCGARSVETLDWINDGINGGAVSETMVCGLDRISISEDAAKKFESILGPIPNGHLGLEKLDSIHSQSSWHKGLNWAVSQGVNLYDPPQKYQVRVFDFDGMYMRKNSFHPRRIGYAQASKKLPMSLFKIDGEFGVHGYLRKPPQRNAPSLQVNLSELDDLRRARYLLCQYNNRVPFSFHDNKLMIPKFMHLPIDLDHALHLMSGRSSEEVDPQPFGKAKAYSGLSEEIATHIVSKIWLPEDEITDEGAKQ